ncbi:unnamed protein product, partial [Amaranthus hypochondriacus]
MYTSLSQTCSDVRMVQSLVPIWEEEFQRSGVLEADILGDAGRPPPEDVLRTLSNGIEYMDKLKELYTTEKSTLPATSKNMKKIMFSQCPMDEGILVGTGNVESNDLISRSSDIVPSVESQNPVSTDALVASLGERKVDELDIAQVTEGVVTKGADAEDVALLQWLASSQAAEDINSDDELHRETILNPLLPAATINKVLEKANTDYENESQQECQDILDSIVDVLICDHEKGENTFSGQGPETKIPQVDGAGDDQESTSAASSPEQLVLESLSSKRHTFTCGSSSFDFVTKKKRHKLQRGSLPFSEDQQTSGQIQSGPNTKNTDNKGSCVADLGTLDCSVRDLMRKKRCFRTESSSLGKNVVEEGS